MGRMPVRDALLLSIRKEFADLLFSRKKTVELRRVKPNVKPGDRLLVYVPAPVGAFVGSLTVGSVTTGTPTALWNAVGAESGLSKEQFFAYFRGLSSCHAIGISAGKRWSTPVPRETAVAAHPGFRPPQGYIYLRAVRDADHPLRELLMAA
jgi:predicted transcriptional regulator